MADKEIMQIDIDELFGNSGVEVHEMNTDKVIASYKESRDGKKNSGPVKTKVTVNKGRGNNYA